MSRLSSDGSHTSLSTSMNGRIALAALLLTATACATATPSVHLPVTTPPATFVVVAGDDTLAVERYQRTTDSLRGVLEGRQQGIVQEWTLELSPAGGVSRAHTAVRRVGTSPSSPPLQALSVVFGRDSARITAGDARRTIAAPAATLPFVNLSAGVLEQIVRQARATAHHADSTVTVPLLPFGASQVVVARVRGAGGDTVMVDVGGVELLATVDGGGALLGALVPSQGVRFIRADGDYPLPDSVTAGSTPLPDYSVPAGAPYTAHDVTIRNHAAGLTLAGTLTLPEGASARAPVPAVVLISGSGAQDRNSSTPALPGWAPFLQIADTLGRRGIAVLRLDDRGVGGSQPGGVTATVRDLAGDVRTALAYLRTRPEVNRARLALVGHSEGAMVAPMVAVADSGVMAVVLLAAPARVGRVISDSQVAEVMRERGVPPSSLDSLLRQNAVVRDSMAARDPWMAFWLDYDPLPTARQLRVPTLIVQGETDRQVSPDQATELAAAIRAGGDRDVTVRLFPQVNHLLVHDPSGAFDGYRSLPSMQVEPAVLGAIADWLVVRMER